MAVRFVVTVLVILLNFEVIRTGASPVGPLAAALKRKASHLLPLLEIADPSRVKKEHVSLTRIVPRIKHA